MAGEWCVRMSGSGVLDFPREVVDFPCFVVIAVVQVAQECS